MSSKKQTSIEYLIKEFSDILGPLSTKPMQDLLLFDAIKQAKEMHEQELKECAETFEMCYYNGSHNGMTFEEYYNETYDNGE